MVALFHVLEKEIALREAAGRPAGGFGVLKAFKPIVAVGAEHPLEEELIMADHFRTSASPFCPPPACERLTRYCG